MSLQDYQQKIIQLYLQMELQTATLYDLFAAGFPDHREFWAAMAGEEREHAAWIQHLLDGARQDKVQFVESKTRTYTVTACLDYLQGVIAEYRQTPFDIVRAAAIAIDLERSLIEKNVFRHFTGDSEKAVRVLGVLTAGQDEHVRRIEEFAAAIRSTPTAGSGHR